MKDNVAPVAIMIVGIVIGFFGGHGCGTSQEKQRAIDAEAAHWKIDEKTGMVEFQYIGKRPKD